MIKYHNISNSVRKMGLRKVAVQTVFRIVSAAAIIKIHLWYRIGGYIVIVNCLAGITNVALLLPPMVYIRYVYQIIVCIRICIIRYRTFGNILIGLLN